MKIGRDADLPVLPNEVLTEILSWVPVKPLVQFRYVCKFWKSLISCPSFVKLHLQRTSYSKTQNLILQEFKLKQPLPGSDDTLMMSCSIRSLLLHKNSSSIHINNLVQDYDSSYCFLFNSKYSVLGSCNGLLCLLACSYSTGGNSIECKYWFCLWNPTMKIKSKNSLTLLVHSEAYEVVPIKFGFGYDKSSDTYKVVAVINDDYFIMNKDSSKGTHVKIYTMGGEGEHCWRDIVRPFPTFPQSQLKFLNGTLNWLSSTYFFSASWHLEIVSLDLGKETYKQFSLPDNKLELLYNNTFFHLPEIAVLGDFLCLSHDYKNTHFVVWLMKEFGVEKSWTQFLNVSYQHLQITPWKLIEFSVVPLCLSENGDFLMLLYFNSEIIIYNLREKRAERVKICNIKVLANDHVQSLVLPC